MEEGGGGEAIQPKGVIKREWVLKLRGLIKLCMQGNNGHSK